MNASAATDNHHPTGGKEVSPIPPPERALHAPGAALRDRRLAVAVLLVLGVGGLLMAGVPSSTLLFLGAAGGCVLMHLFMGHGGHGAHSGHGARGNEPPSGGSDTAAPAHSASGRELES